MKPDWKDAPEWAQWLAMDKDGSWVWFEGEPYRVMESPLWQRSPPPKDSWEYAGATGGKYWNRSKEPRP